MKNSDSWHLQKACPRPKQGRFVLVGGGPGRTLQLEIVSVSVLGLKSKPKPKDRSFDGGLGAENTSGEVMTFLVS